MAMPHCSSSVVESGSSAAAAGEIRTTTRKRLVLLLGAAAMALSLWPWMQQLAILAAAAAALRRTHVWPRAAVPLGRGNNAAAAGAPVSSAAAATTRSREWWAAIATTVARPVIALVSASAMLFKRARVSSSSSGQEAEEDNGDPGAGAAAGGCSCSSGTTSPSILDLPDLALDSILGRLPARSLLQAAGICKELRSRCIADHLWEALVYEKWGKLAGPEAYRAWRSRDAAAGLSANSSSSSSKHRTSFSFSWSSLRCLWPPSWWLNLARDCTTKKPPPRPDSLMAWYWALESGNFWFRAQVYNREHGHVGFILSCYDADLSYDRASDTFRARYPPHGSRAVVVEEGIPWERLRAVPVETPAHSLHASDCLAELKPGDHIEVQWRRNKEFPYGWWYGIVGHTETCSASGRHCACRLDNTIWLVFNQYTQGSRWRRAAIDRRNHREEGNEAEGFYGGVRKLRTKDEISIWESLWPAEILE